MLIAGSVSILKTVQFVSEWVLSSCCLGPFAAERDSSSKPRRRRSVLNPIQSPLRRGGLLPNGLCRIFRRGRSLSNLFFFLPCRDRSLSNDKSKCLPCIWFGGELVFLLPFILHS